MSVWSLIRKGRAQAKAASAKATAEKTAEKTVEKTPVRYMHIPTHAASDALIGAPMAMKDVDRERIVEYNRRQSTLAMPTVHRSMGSLYAGVEGHGGNGGNGGGGLTILSGSASLNGSVKSGTSGMSSGGGGWTKNRAGRTSWNGRMAEVLYADPSAPPPVPESFQNRGYGGSSTQVGKGKGKEVNYSLEYSDVSGNSSNVLSLPPVLTLPFLSSELSTLSPLSSLNLPMPPAIFNSNPNSIANSSTSSLTLSSTDSSSDSHPTNHRRTSSGTHRLHPSQRQRSNSIGTSSPSASPSPPPLWDRSRPPPAHRREISPRPAPIIPDVNAAGFIFDSGVSSRPTTAQGDKSSAPGALANGGGHPGYAVADTRRSLWTGRFMEHQEPGYSTSFHNANESTPMSSTSDILWSNASSAMITPANSMPVTSGYPRPASPSPAPAHKQIHTQAQGQTPGPTTTKSYPPSVAASRGMYRRFERTDTKEVTRPLSRQSRQSNESVGSIKRLRGFFSRSRRGSVA